MLGFGISQSGIDAARRGIENISNNLANQNTEGYKKQVIDLQATTAESIGNGMEVGTGVKLVGVTHVTSQLMLDSIYGHTSRTEYFNELHEKMSEVEFLFSDNDNIGLINDLQQFFAAANNLKNDTYNQAYKDIFVSTAEVLVDNVKVMDQNLQELKTNNEREVINDIDRINSILSEIQNINAKINDDTYSPTLVDQRNLLEKELATLTSFEIKADTSVEDNTYYIMIGNHRVLDDSGYREFRYDEASQKVMLENKDVTNEIRGGKLGADLRFSIAEGNELDKVKDSIFVFMSELVEQVNDVYSESAKYDFTSRMVDIEPSDFSTTPLLDIPDLKGLQPGDITFAIHVDPDTVKEYTYNINSTTTLEDIQNSLDSQIKADFSGVNDILDFGTNGITSQFNISSKYPMQILDDNTNFNKMMNYNQFFEGDSIGNLKVNEIYVQDSSKLFVETRDINQNINNDIATRLTDLQYQEVDFQKATIFEGLSRLRPQDQANGELCFDATTTYKSMKKQTFLDFLDDISFNVSKTTNNLKNTYNVEKGITDSIVNKFDKMTKVSQDEELMELIKYQAAYNANAKVISALDEMINTILGIK